MKLDTLYYTSCMGGMTELEDESVDLIMTSPPYPKGMREYEEDCCVDADRYGTWFEPLLDASRRVLKRTGSMVLVLMDKIVNGEIHPYIDDLKRQARSHGFAFIEDILWHKSNPLPTGNYERRPIRAYEHCLWFARDVKLYKWNGDAIRKPYAQSTLNRYGAGNIETLHKRSGGQANQTWVNVEPNAKGAAGNNVIYGCRYSGRNPGHPAKFPEYLPKWFIHTLTDSDDIVLDPFAGSGTTLIVAKRECRHFLGYEIAEGYYNRATHDLEHTWAEPDMFDESIGES